MTVSWSPRSPLNGSAVVLSASVPHPRRDRRFLSGPLNDLLMLRLMEQRIFDAVQSLVAEVLGSGGRLVHGGHPTITNAIATQASNWSTRKDSRPGETQPEIKPPIVIYQSEFFSHLPPPPGREEMVSQGLAIVRWTPASLKDAQINNEPLLKQVPLQQDWINAWLPGQAPATAAPDQREALLTMRLVMLLESQPSAVVSIGGMEGIEAESQLYLDLCGHELLPGPAVVNVLASTFGAAAQLNRDSVRVLDDERPESSRLERLQSRDISEDIAAPNPLLERINYNTALHGLIQSLASGSPTTPE